MPHVLQRLRLSPTKSYSVDQAYVASVQMVQTIKVKYGVAFLDELKAKSHLFFNAYCTWKSQIVAIAWMKRLPNGLLNITSQDYIRGRGIEIMSFVMTRQRRYLILQPTANSCQHHFKLDCHHKHSVFPASWTRCFFVITRSHQRMNRQDSNGNKRIALRCWR